MRATIRACSSLAPNPATSTAHPGWKWYCSGTNGAGGAVRTASRTVTSREAAAASSRPSWSASAPWARSKKNRPKSQRPNLVQLELELGDDAEVATATAQSPEQVGVFLLRGSQDSTVGGDHLGRDEVV